MADLFEDIEAVEGLAGLALIALIAWGAYSIYESLTGSNPLTGKAASADNGQPRCSSVTDPNCTSGSGGPCGWWEFFTATTCYAASAPVAASGSSSGSGSSFGPCPAGQSQISDGVSTWCQ